MKAKEYIAKYHAARENGATDIECVGAMFIQLTQEAVAIGLQRGGGKFAVPDHVALGVIREQDLKWRAIAHALGFNPNGFKDALSEKGVRF